MPTLEAGSKPVNIMKSINAFVDAQIRVGLGLTVYYEGQGRLGSLPSTWVESFIIPGAYVGPLMVAGSNSHSLWNECFLNLNVFQKLDSPNQGLANIYALSDTVTDIKALFGHQTVISVRDYDTSGTPVVDGLRVVEPPIPRPVPTPPDMGVAQMNLSVPLRHHQVMINN